MALISRLGVVLGLDSAEFNAGLGKAEAGLGKFKAGSMASAAGVAALGAAFVAASKSALDFADGINDIAKANEMSVGTVLEFSQALSVSGGKAENASKFLSSFTNKIDEAAQGSQKTRDSFKELGVSLKDIGTLTEKELLEKTMQGLSKIEDPIRRNAMAMDLFGKAVKGVDLKGMADEFNRIEGTMAGSDATFAKIGDSIDRLDRLGFKIKTDLATNLSEPFEKGVAAAEKFYAYLSENSERLTKERDKNKLVLAQASVDANMQWHQKMLAGFGMGSQIEQAKQQATTAHYTPMDTNWEYKPNFSAGTEEAKSKRALELTNEQKAAREKLTKQIESESEALSQQVRQLQLQTSELGHQSSQYEKVTLEFEKGGKYYEIRNTSNKQDLLDAAKALDEKKHRLLIEKTINDYAKERERLAFEELQANQQLAAQELIRKQQHDDQMRFMVDDTNRATERLDLERAMAGQSDTQVRKALEYFDVQTKIMQMKRQDGLLTEEQTKAYEEAENARILANEANTRAQNTFQAGWAKAYNNFTERAKDSAALGAEAFNSMTSHMESALDNFVETGKLSFSDLAGSIIKDLIRIQMKAQMSSMFSGIFGGGGGGFGNFLTTSSTNFANGGGLLGFLGFADGGTPPVNQPSIVGERGPELFVPKTSGTIIPNNSLSGMMGNQPQVVYNGPYIANLSAIDTQSATQFLAKNKSAVWSANQSAQRSLPQSR